VIDFIPMHDVHEPGRRGDHSLDRFEIVKPDLRMMLRPSEYIAPGKYIRLSHGSAVVMSDTDMEKRSNYTVLHKAHGDVLIGGLGIGMVLLPILRKPEVRSVLVVEKYSDVSDLVLPGLFTALSVPQQHKLRVEIADLMDWKPLAGQFFDTIYFDIWNEICQDNLTDITKLKRRLARRVRPAGWMGAWMEEKLRYQKRADARREAYW
jgi:spermidine synthase